MPYEVMEDRRDVVMRKLSEISFEYGESRVGSVEEVYVEGAVRRIRAFGRGKVIC